MLDTLKRLAMMGIGVVSMAENEIQEMIAELCRKGELSEEEGQKVLTEYRDRVAANQREVKDVAGKVVQDAMKTTGLPSRDEFNALAARVEALESQLNREQR